MTLENWLRKVLSKIAEELFGLGTRNLRWILNRHFVVKLQCTAYISHPRSEFPGAGSLEARQLSGEDRIGMMAGPRMMENMINSGVPPNKHESSSSILPLPLNLIALVISYVRCNCEDNDRPKLNIAA